MGDTLKYVPSGAISLSRPQLRPSNQKSYQYHSDNKLRLQGGGRAYSPASPISPKQAPLAVIPIIPTRNKKFSSHATVCYFRKKSYICDQI